LQLNTQELDSFDIFRTAGYEFHAEHLQPGGGDAQAETAEAGEEAPAVPFQGGQIMLMTMLIVPKRIFFFLTKRSKMP
jgi:hypothetical protein